MYIVPSQENKPIKIMTDDVDIMCNEDMTISIKQKIHPEEMYKINGKLYMKWRGEWYEMETEDE